MDNCCTALFKSLFLTDSVENIKFLGRCSAKAVTRIDHAIARCQRQYQPAKRFHHFDPRFHRPGTQFARHTAGLTVNGPCPFPFSSFCDVKCCLPACGTVHDESAAQWSGRRRQPFVQLLSHLSKGSRPLLQQLPPVFERIDHTATPRRFS